MAAHLSSTQGGTVLSLYFATWKFDTRSFHTSNGKNNQQESMLAVLTVKPGPPKHGWQIMDTSSVPAMKKLLKTKEHAYQVQRLLGSSGR